MNLICSGRKSRFAGFTLGCRWQHGLGLLAAQWMMSAFVTFGAESGVAISRNRQPGLVLSEFIFEHSPFQASHASTIVETKEGLLAAWFGGTRERNPDVSIWMSRHEGSAWSDPKEVVNGIVPEQGRRYPCWNPVLFYPEEGPLHLFYKVGPSPSAWWGMLMLSRDHGKTWSEPRRLPKNIYGPIRNKPVQLEDGAILCGSSTEDAGWRVHIEHTRTLGESWSRTPPLNNAMEFGAIQPTIAAYRTNHLLILCRTKQQRIVESWSRDGGLTWTPLQRTILPNPNSAIDAVLLKDTRVLLVYNHSTNDRGILNVAVSPEGKNWKAALVLENTPGDEYSYPAVIQTRDGLAHVTYTWNRKRIKHVVIDPAKLSARDLPDGQWPND